jgi:rfaE bifunctional protein kinase chain/domain
MTSPVDYAQHVKRFSALKVVVLGDVMLDIYEFCSTLASKPIDSEKAGKRAYAAQTTVKTLGGAGNVAANLASLGVAASLIGVTGNDGHYFTLQQLSDQIGVKHCFIRDRDRPTTSKNRLYIDGDYLLRRDDESSSPISHETSLTLLNEVLCEIDGASAVILSDYSKGVFQTSLAEQVIAACRARKVPVVVDFKPHNRELFRDATIMSPNDREAEQLFPGFKADIETGIQKLRTLLDADCVVVTLGNRGICGFDGVDYFHVEGNEVDEVDAVGCGDTVRAVLALGCALGLDYRDAAALANDAAAIIVQKPATAMVTQEELTAFLNGKYGLP